MVRMGWARWGPSGYSETFVWYTKDADGLIRASSELLFNDPLEALGFFVSRYLLDAVVLCNHSGVIAISSTYLRSTDTLEFSGDVAVFQQFLSVLGEQRGIPYRWQRALVSLACMLGASDPFELSLLAVNRTPTPAHDLVAAYQLSQQGLGAMETILHECLGG